MSDKGHQPEVLSDEVGALVEYSLPADSIQAGEVMVLVEYSEDADVLEKRSKTSPPIRRQSPSFIQGKRDNQRRTPLQPFEGDEMNVAILAERKAKAKERILEGCKRAAKRAGIPENELENRLAAAKGNDELWLMLAYEFVADALEKSFPDMAKAE